jgi:hypothetical protein
VLAAPVVLEYVTDYQKTAVTVLICLGIVAASVILPPVGYGLALGEAGAIVGITVSLAKGVQMTYGKHHVPAIAITLPDC